jgi:hypothetical protein
MTRVPEGFDIDDLRTCSTCLEPVIEILARTDGIDPTLYVGCWSDTAAVYGETTALRLLDWLAVVHSLIREGLELEHSAELTEH